MLGLRKEPPLAPQVLEEAAEWLMRLSERELSEHERAEWERWKVSSPEHDRAWSRAQLLQSKLGGLPPSLAMSALDRPNSPERRAALGKLAILLAVMPVGWGSWKLAQSQQWSAPRTDPGRWLAYHPEHRNRHRRSVRRPPTAYSPARRRNPGADRRGHGHPAPTFSDQHSPGTHAGAGYTLYRTGIEPTHSPRGARRRGERDIGR